LIVIPAAFLILYVGLGYLLFSWIPLVGTLIGKLLLWLIWLLNRGVSFVESLPHSLISGIDIGILTTWAIYMIVISGTVALVYKKKRMLMASFVILSGLMIWQIYELFELKRNPYLVVYDVRGETVLNLLSERENLLYCDKKWISDKSKQQFHLRNNWNKHAAPEPFFFKDTTHSSIRGVNEHIFLYEGHSLAILDKALSVKGTEKKVELDYLILSYHKGLSLEEMMTWMNPKCVILDGTIRGKTIERLKKEAEGVNIHAVNEDGYFSQRL
jgi:competence protein ComEC